MTIPINRQRVKHRKTRTGCRTCRARRIKCDEERPICGNCVKSKKPCAGYEVPAAPLTQGHALVLPKVLISRAPRTIGLQMNSLESSSFDFFRRFTIFELPGSGHMLSWEKLIRQASLEEVAVTHAVIALAAAHRSQIASPVVGDGGQFAISQYTKAISHLSGLLARGKSHMETVLLLTLLFYSFNVLQGNDLDALMHFRNGLSILCQHHSIPLDDATESRIQVRIEPRSTMELLTQTFVRLDNDVMMAEAEEPCLQPYLERPEIPERFQSMDEMLVHLDVLSGEAATANSWVGYAAERSLEQNRPDWEDLEDDTQQCLCSTEMRIVHLSEKLLDRLEKIRKDLNAWMTAHAMYRPTPEEKPLYILASVNSFFWWLQISYGRRKSQMDYDELLVQFEHIVSLVEQYIALSRQPGADPNSTRPALTTGTNIHACLYDISARCRSAVVRRRCMNAMRSLNLQGTLDGYWLASYAGFIAELEEKQARAITGDYTTIDLLPHDFPEASRILDIEGLDDLGDGTPHPDFYKLDVGRAIWTKSAANGYEGDIEMEFGHFAVMRPHTDFASLESPELVLGCSMGPLDANLDPGLFSTPALAC